MTPDRTIDTTLNHVGMSMAMDELDRESDAILAFYRELFGWSGYRDMEAEGAPLIIVLDQGRQFLFVYGETRTTGARPMDHFGVAVATEDELDLVLERARRAQELDPRVDIVEKGVTHAGAVDVVHCYVRFVLPLMVEVQHFRPVSPT